MYLHEHHYWFIAHMIWGNMEWAAEAKAPILQFTSKHHQAVSRDAWRCSLRVLVFVFVFACQRTWISTLHTVEIRFDSPPDFTATCEGTCTLIWTSRNWCLEVCSTSCFVQMSFFDSLICALHKHSFRPPSGISESVAQMEVGLVFERCSPGFSDDFLHVLKG